MRAARHPLVVGLERQSQPIVGNAHIAVSAARYGFRHHGLHLLRHHPDIGGVAAVVDEAIIAEAVVEPPEQHDIVLEAHVGATPAAATPAAATSAAAASAAAEAAAAPPPPKPPPPRAAAAHAAAAEATRHSPAAHGAAIGEGRVGPAHPHTAHRRASRSANVRPRRGTRCGPCAAAGPAGRPCSRTIGRLPAAWPARAADPAGAARAANSSWPADPAGPARTANSAWPADPAGSARAANSSWPADAARPARAANPAWPADPAGSARAANSAWPADAARPPRAANPAGPSRPAGAAGPVGADPRLAAHAGPIVPIRPPRLHVIADVAEVDVIPDIDVAVIDVAMPARVASPDRRIDRACSPIPVIVVPQRPDRDAGPEAQQRRDSGIGLIDRSRIIGRDIDGRRIGRLDGDIARRRLRRCRPLRRAGRWRCARLHPFDRLLIGRLERPGRFRLLREAPG